MAKRSSPMYFKILLATMLLAAAVSAHGAPADWIRPADTSAPLVWGHKQGLVFGLPSRGGLPGPRGLIRVGVLSTTGVPKLINFIAVEPVVKGTSPRHRRMGFSELEKSSLDAGRQGKRLWATEPAGELSKVSSSHTSDVERLAVRIEVEPFAANSAHVYLVASIRSDRPNELELTVHHHDDSASIDELTVTATMGNYMRLRHLWLAGRIVDSRHLYEGYTGDDFVEYATYPKDEMLSWKGDSIVLATTDELDPASVAVRGSSWWNFRGPKLTQYWRVPRVHVQPDLHTRVNGRRVYWSSRDPIPGGPSYENFEVRQKYVPGQVFVFGLTKETPHAFHPPIVPLASMPE